MLLLPSNSQHSSNFILKLPTLRSSIGCLELEKVAEIIGDYCGYFSGVPQ